MNTPILWRAISTMTLVIAAITGCSEENKVKKTSAPESTPEIEVISRMAEKDSEVNIDNRRAEGSRVSELINIPIEVRKINDFIYMATGMANTYMITTSEGNVVVDTGFAFQAKKQYKLLQEVSDAPISHIMIAQGQFDDTAGIDYWRGGDTKVIMTRTTTDYMPWRAKVHDWLIDHRFSVLYNWSSPLIGLKDVFYPYNPITPDIIVEEREGYAFKVGAIRFEVLALPGAEGTNSTGLWLPDHKILLSGGGFLGPYFPMWPNLGTVRGDKNRLVEPYLDSLNTVIALEPEMILTGQEDPAYGKESIREKLVLIRDSVQYVHDEVIEGLNDGKNVYQLMQGIKLPKHLAHIPQVHGRMDWTIRNMVYGYGGWFQYRNTSELYPYPVTDVYKDLVDIAGVEPILKRANTYLEKGDFEHALLLVEIALEAEPDNHNVRKTQAAILIALRDRSRNTHNNFSEIAWLEMEIDKANDVLN